MTFRFEIGLSERLYCLLERLIKPIPTYTFKEGKFMYIVKTDNPDVAYSISAAQVTDSEGNQVPETALSYEVTSDNPDVVSITPNPDDALSGSIHFGNPGQANINVNVLFGSQILGAFGAQFTTTVGDPAAITGGGISFAGLTEAEA